MLSWYERKVHPGNPNDCYFLILNEKEQPIGEISFHRYNPDKGSGDLNVKVHAAYRRQRYARRAMAILARFYFYHLGGRMLKDRVSQE